MGFALCGAVEVSSSVALLANQKDNHAIIDTSWHCEMLVNVSSRNRTEDFEVILMEVNSVFCRLSFNIDSSCRWNNRVVMLSVTTGRACRIHNERSVSMGPGGWADFRRMFSVGKIRPIRGVFPRGSQRLSGIFVGTSCMERPVSRSASSLSGIVHSKNSKRKCHKSRSITEIVITSYIRKL